MTKFAYLSLLLLSTTSLVLSAGTQFITGPCENDAACASGCCGFNSGLCAGAIIALTRDGGCGHGDAAPNANAANALGQGTFTVSGAASATQAATQATPQAASNPSAAGAMCPVITVTVTAGAAGNAGGAAAAATPAPAASSAASGSSGTSNKGAGNGVGAQFITGPCLSDADCASQCCAFNTGLCAGAVVAQEAKDGGCGFGNATPNNNAEKQITGQAKRGLWDD